LISCYLLGQDPFTGADRNYVDKGYGNTNIQEGLIDLVLDKVEPEFWLEVGSMLGGSLIKTTDAIKRHHHLATSIVSIDPFSGDVGMWEWNKPRKTSGDWSYLKLVNGRPTIYERFLANVREAGHDDSSTTHVFINSGDKAAEEDA